MQDLVPCILVTFDKEQIVVWRGKDYQPAEDDYYFADRDPFNNPVNGLVSDPEEPGNSDDGSCSQQTQRGYYPEEA